MSEVISVSNPSMNQFVSVIPVQNVDPKQPGRFSAEELVVPISPIHVGFKVGEIFTSRVEALEKVTKNAHRFIDIGSKLQLFTSKALENFSTNLKAAVELFDSIRFIMMLNLFFSPQRNGKYFLLDKENSFYKKADRLFLAGHLVCKSARTLDKGRLIDLGRIAQLKIGKYLSAFSTFTDSLMVGCSFFNVLDSFGKLQKFGEKSALNALNVKKWQERPHILELVKEGNEQVINDLKERWEQKIVDKQAELEMKRQDFKVHPARQTKKEIIQLSSSIKKVEIRLTHIASGNHNLLFQEMSRIDTTVRLDKCRVKQAALEHDCKINWVKIAASITKIAVIAMALTFTALNFTAVLPLVALLALGIISDSFGLAKVAMEHRK